ncbi:MAG TPA: HEPN domain-containing protein [Syntrophales bacterium]|nr:HEPN domain-containing protein [Syntrophales bacterium]
MKDKENPMGMIKDPFAGDSYVLPSTFCTDQRRLWFKRSNQILRFFMSSEWALKECKKIYENRLITQRGLSPDTPMRIQSSDGRSLILPARVLLSGLASDVDVLCRQIFVMLYGSLETYLFELIERSFKEIGQTEDILGKSLDIMMRGKWDAKIGKMNHIFELNYRASDLMEHFKGFELNFMGNVFRNPLSFLDELAQIRHRIIHASSIIDQGKLIYIDTRIFQGYYIFCALLTDFTDNLFVNKFKFDRTEINPADA